MTGTRAPLKIVPSHRTASSGKTGGVPPADTSAPPKPKLLDQLRESLHLLEAGYDIRTIQELFLLRKPPALPGDSQSLTVPGICL